MVHTKICKYCGEMFRTSQRHSKVCDNCKIAKREKRIREKLFCFYEEEYPFAVQKI